MKIYLAGTAVSKPKEEIKLQELFKQGCKLHSYFHCVDGFERKWFRMNTRNKVDLFLDSGAFSAKNKNIEIDIQEYIEFIKINEKHINCYANLDVIGNPKATLKNQKIMEKAGLSPVPVFHFGEDPELYLKPLIGKYEYIALGGLVVGANKRLIPWLDNTFKKYLLDKNMMPLIKVHGFGITSFQLLFRYPWFSVDSTSWVVTGRVGSIFIPRYKNGKWVYNEPPLKIAVSSKSPNLKEAGRHIETLSPRQKQIFVDYLNDKHYVLGRSEFVEKSQTYELQDNEKWAEKKPVDKKSKRLIEIIHEPGISNTYQLRDELNVSYYLEVEKALPEWPWAFAKEKKTLFS